LSELLFKIVLCLDCILYCSICRWNWQWRRRCFFGLLCLAL